MTTKQDTLVSGTNIKTINNQSILGSGNINIEGGSGGTSDYNELTNKPSINGVELTGDKTNSQLGIPTKTSDLTNDSGFLTSESEPAFNSSPAKNITNNDISNWNGKQDTLVSGSNIKTINNQNILGSGNIEIEGVSDYTELTNKPSINGTTLNGNVNLATPEQLNTKQDTLVSGTNIKTVNNESLLGSGNITIEGEPAVNPFKGWFNNLTSLQTITPITGDYAYVKGATTADPIEIYECTTAGTWTDSGREFNSANDQSFATSQPLNEVHIKDENGNDVSGSADVLSADALGVSVESDGRGDLDISDENGNVLARYENGHFRTKNFYSGDACTKDELDDLSKEVNKVINVKSYGAVGDGVTDDTSALENAFADGFTTKRPVVFPDGTYLIRRPLTLRSGMEVYGLGNATIKKKTSTTTTLTASLSAGSSTMTVASVSGFEVGDYIFVSSESRIYPAARHCSVGIITAINTSTKQITFESAYKDQKAGAVKTHAVGCYVSNSCALIRSWGTKYECIGAYIHHLTLDGNRVSGEFGDWMNGCIHIDACTGTVEGITYDKEARDNTFKDLVIKNSPFDGISDQGNGGAYIENCKISNSYMHGVHFGTVYSSATITHNYLKNTENGAACFWCQDVENLIFDGNIVDSCYKGCSDYEYGTAGQSSIINNNIFINITNYVFDFSHSVTADFQGRMILNGNLIEGVNYNIGTFANKSNINISDNIVKNYSTTPSYLFNLSGASNVILSCNLAPTINNVVNGNVTRLINVNNSWN
jgi:hypothetical protein